MSFKDKDKQREYQRNWIAARRVEYIKLRGGVCCKCSSAVDLEFHHRDRMTKLDHKIWSWSISRLEAELMKCDLLCRECHFKETTKERNYYMSKHGSLNSYKSYGCRCEDCRAANAGYEHGRRLKVRMYEVTADDIGLGVRLPDTSTISADCITIV